MPLSYNPAHAKKWVPTAGTFEFGVLSCEPTVFSTGSEGIRLMLEVDAGGHNPLKISTHVVFGERSTWKMRELCECLNVRFDPPCEASDLVGKRGVADFVVDERDGLISLSVARYHVSK